MSRAEVRIPLAKPVKLGSKTYTHIRVVAPTYGDYMDIGEVISGEQTDVGRVTVEHLDRIKAYADRLVRTGDDDIAEPAVLAEAGHRLARKVHEAIVNFLYSPEDETGTTSPTSSSSGSAGTSTQ